MAAGTLRARAACLGGATTATARVGDPGKEDT